VLAAAADSTPLEAKAILPVADPLIVLPPVLETRHGVTRLEVASLDHMERYLTT
jgi:hypothetical protein